MKWVKAKGQEGVMALQQAGWFKGQTYLYVAPNSRGKYVAWGPNMPPTVIEGAQNTEEACAAAFVIWRMGE